MATTKKTKTNPYAGKSKAELLKAYQKLESDYQVSLSRGKLSGSETSILRKERARLLTAIAHSE